MNKKKANRKVFISYIERGDINGLYQFIRNESYSATVLLITYKTLTFRHQDKKNKSLLELPGFWKSQIPHLYLKSILESDLKVTFLQSYFADNQHFNHDLNHHLISIAKDDFLLHFKLWAVFEKEAFWEGFQQLAAMDQDVDKVREELEVIRKSRQLRKREEANDNEAWKQFKMDEILLGFILYHYNFKQSPDILNNKSRQTEIEVAVVKQLNYVFSILSPKERCAFKYGDNQEIQADFQLYQAPHHTLGKIGPHAQLNKNFVKIFGLIDRSISRFSRRVQEQKYLSGFGDFDKIDANSVTIRENYAFQVFQVNDRKSQPEEHYFIDLRFSDIANGNLKQKPDHLGLATKSLKSFLEFHGIPLAFDLNQKLVDLEKIFLILKTFSIYKAPLSRSIIQLGQEKIVMKLTEPNERFKSIFGSNESITLFSYSKLLNDISSYFNWTIEEVQHLVDLLTCDLAEDKMPSSWLSKPFLRNGERLIWLGGLCKDRRWENILLPALRRADKHFNRLISDALEEQIVQRFNSLDFDTLLNETFKFFKDNYLFLCEAKYGDGSDEYRPAFKKETMKLDGLAAEQLGKAKRYVFESWDVLKEKLKIEKELDFEDLKIVPLIITNYFEGDLRSYKHGTHKISLMELEVLLKNKKRDLLESYMMHKKMTDAFNRKFKDTSADKAWDLWKGTGKFDVKTFVENIDNNAIWKELEEIWEFPQEEFQLFF